MLWSPGANMITTKARLSAVGVSRLTKKSAYILRKCNHLMPIQNKLLFGPLVNSAMRSKTPTLSQKTLLFPIA